MNFSMIRYVIGLVMLFESAFLSLPCLIALIYHEKKGFSFWIMLFVCLIIGILFVMKKPKKTVYYAKEGFLTVAISWIVMSFFGALPFVINGDIPSVVDAMFETVSGFTTTGASILSDVEVRPATLMEKLCPGGTVFTARSSRRVKHVFSELYAVPEDIRKGYLKVKLLELLLFLSTLSPEDGQTPHGCTSAQVTLAEQVKTCLLAEPDRTLTLKTLSQQFNVSEAQIKSSFARVYGMSPAAYARSQRMHGAAALLRETDRTVLDIACQFGYDNASKFARAFRDVIGVSPREYRAGAEYDSCAPRLGEKPVSLSDADAERRI